MLLYNKTENKLYMRSLNTLLEAFMVDWQFYPVVYTVDEISSQTYLHVVESAQNQMLFSKKDISPT